MPFARLPERRVLDLSGEAAEPFLQNLITADLDLLGGGEARPAALLTPQGKILFDFLVSRTETGLRLDVEISARADLAKRLTLYRLRAKVAIDPVEDEVFAVWGEESGVEGMLVDRRFQGASVGRIYGTPPQGPAEATPDAFERLRINAGIAEALTDFATSDVFPHDVLLDQNGGVSFKKGCYVGQEVVSRMQHRGTARRRIMLLSAAGMMARGAAITAGDKPIGSVIASLCGEDGTAAGFGLLRIDRLAAAIEAGFALVADGVPVEATIPPWAGYRLPDATPTDGEAE